LAVWYKPPDGSQSFRLPALTTVVGSELFSLDFQGRSPPERERERGERERERERERGKSA
jgi:hypothetical protein